MKRTLFKPILIATLSIITILGVASGTIAIINKSPNRDIATEVVDVPGSEPPYNFDYSWVKNNPYIAHAFGGILGDSYTNSYEAFLLNYQLGHRVFEVDFYLTDDEYTVAAHDDTNWRKVATIPSDAEIKNSTTDDQFTYANFMSSLWYDKYHPVDLTLLFEILQQYPDVYIVTDTKFSDEENVRKQFTAFVETAKATDLALLDRFIPQIYVPEMLPWIMDIYPWKSVIYTLYGNPDWTPENVLAFSQDSGVKCITLWDTWLNERLTSDEISNWKSANINIATHTINNYARAENSRTRGANAIYTDFLLP